MAQIHTHYDNLKVARNAPPEVIRAAYKTLSQKFHPDRNPGNPEAARIMMIINSSYEVLSDPGRRKEHDQWVSQQELKAAQEATANSSSPKSTPRTAPTPASPPNNRGGGVVSHILKNWGLYGFAVLVILIWVTNKLSATLPESKPYQATPASVPPEYVQKPATWRDISESASYKNLSVKDKDAVRSDFFSRVIAPSLETGEIESVHADFMERTKPGIVDKVRDILPESWGGSKPTSDPSWIAPKAPDTVASGVPRAVDTTTQSTPMTWDQVRKSPGYDDLSSEGKEATRNAYFMEVIAPLFKTEDLADARNRFDQDTSPTLWNKTKEFAGDAVDTIGQAIGFGEKKPSVAPPSETPTVPSVIGTTTQSTPLTWEGINAKTKTEQADRDRLILPDKERAAPSKTPEQFGITASKKAQDVSASLPTTNTGLGAAPNGQPWPASAGYVKGYQRLHVDGLSTVTVDNSGNDADVFVKLVSLDSAKAYPVRQFYIPAFRKFTLNKVTAGSYDIRYRDLRNGGLSRSEAFHLKEMPTIDGTQFSNITMTLYKVQNGNMHTYKISEEEF